MIVSVKYYKDNTRENQIKKAISIINGLQNYYYLVLSPLEEEIVKDAYIDWDDFRSEYRLHGHEFEILITEKPFMDNWFSHEESQYAVISIYDWEAKYAPPSLKAYLAFQIAQALISFVGDISEDLELRMMHDSTEGCMFDLCMNKKDIFLGMIAGNICPQCRGNLHRIGIDEKAIISVERILSYVRSEAIGKPIIFDENAAFIVMRFSNNDENDHAFLYGIKPALEELGIRCIRADSVLTSAQILEIVERNIERCRVVIAKVDSDNLNVYFELGLAMGLNKDVLLISQDDLTINLPIDLRNWACLTYPKGNYEQLKNRVKQFFIDNYHY